MTQKPPMTAKQERNVQFLFYCAKLPSNARRRKIQLRTRYAGKLRHYEKPIKRLSPEAAAQAYGTNTYDSLGENAAKRLDHRLEQEPRGDQLANAISYLQNLGTFCRDIGNSQIILGTDTVTPNRLALIAASMQTRRLRKIATG
jgi:hypothetical protein